MTEEQFREIIKPIGLIGKEENRTFIETALIGNFKMWLEDNQALDLATVSCSSSKKHILEYSIWSSKVSWCPICKEHFYNSRNEKHTTKSTNEHYHILNCN